MDNVQSNIFFAGQRLNDLTGYSGIEALKRDIEEQERGLQTTRTSLQQAREAYSAAISQRSTSQREVNELLQRKHAWAPSDLERFTALYRSDHANEQAESMAKEQLESIERKAEEAASRLSASILARYHEEQIWSDKIRRMSTWGTWGLMGVNVLLFLVFQILVEPWRRKRLVTGFEDKVMEALAEREAVPVGIITKIETEMSPSSSHSSPETITPAEQKLGNELTLEPTSAVLEEANYVASSTAGEELTPTDVSKSRSVIEYAKKALRDRFSNGQITMRRLDLTIIALESAAIGMATVGLAILFLSRRQ
ncbi:sensitivity to high expression protein she9 [Peltigera leucophlebia]|nr:sensitivity to high expression protein she9 [Peltigera leucophlebia]